MGIDNCPPLAEIQLTQHVGEVFAENHLGSRHEFRNCD